MILADVHNHSDFSFDGKASLTQMVRAARKKGLRYFGIAEHFDLDFLAAPFFYGETEITQTTNAAAYFTAARALQQKANDDRFRLLAGAEFGFHSDERIQDEFCKIAQTYCPDFIINSVHACDGTDCMEQNYFTGKRKETAYARYLERVRESLDCPYPYDIVAHLGYVSRRAAYPESKLRYRDFPDLYDSILKTIVRKEKILEINSSARNAGSDFLPDTDILCRYYELGGRKVSFGSDAHNTHRIGDKRETLTPILKKIGFTFLTIPVCGEHISLDI